MVDECECKGGGKGGVSGGSELMAPRVIGGVL